MKEKQVWKPDRREYWYVMIMEVPSERYGYAVAVWKFWEGSKIDKQRVREGNCFQNEASCESSDLFIVAGGVPTRKIK